MLKHDYLTHYISQEPHLEVVCAVSLWGKSGMSTGERKRFCSSYLIRVKEGCMLDKVRYNELRILCVQTDRDLPGLSYT